MKHRIIEERDSNGNLWNYEIQAKVFFIWLPVGNARTLDFAQESIAKLDGNTRTVVPNV